MHAMHKRHTCSAQASYMQCNAHKRCSGVGGRRGAHLKRGTYKCGDDRSSRGGGGLELECLSLAPALAMPFDPIALGGGGGEGLCAVEVAIIKSDEQQRPSLVL